MRLTPLDIRKQEFSRGMRGYNPDEVDAFLQMLSNQWQELLDEQRHQEEKLSNLRDKLSHYEKVEEALQEALQTARESSQRTLDNAEQKARLVLQEAEARAEQIRQGAEKERQQVHNEMMQLAHRNEEVAVRLRAFLQSELELLSRYEQQGGSGGASPREAVSDRRATPQPAGSTTPAVQEKKPGEKKAGAASEGDVQERDAAPAPAREAAAPRTEAAGAEAKAPAPAKPREEVPEATAPPRGDASDASEDAPTPSREEKRTGPGWVVRPVISGGAGVGHEETRDAQRTDDEDDENVAASSDEIEKIRRILKDLD